MTATVPSQTRLHTRYARVLRLLWHFLAGTGIAAFHFPRWTHAERRDRIGSWSRELLAILGVRIVEPGARPAVVGGYLIVANHVSWLDIFVINALQPARFVSKAEVRQWPLIGWLSARAGTLFLERERRRDLARVGAAVAEALHAGDVCAVFPEGTTTDGSELLRFHGSLLQPAVASGAAVLPLALRYVALDGSLCTAVAYHQQRTVWDTLRDITRHPLIEVEVSLLEPLDSALADRRELAAAAHAAISRALTDRARYSRTGTTAAPPDSRR